MTAPTSLTLASSIALRLRCLAHRVHALGERPLYELMCELVGGADPIGRFEVYGSLDAEFIARLGGDKLTPTIKIVK